MVVQASCVGFDRTLRESHVDERYASRSVDRGWLLQG